MARMTIVTCDYCKGLDMVAAEATEHLEFTLNGVKLNWDVCDPHGYFFRQIEFVADQLRRMGEEQDPEPEPEDPTETHVVEREEPPAQVELAKPEPPEIEPPEPAKEAEEEDEDERYKELKRKLAELERQQAAVEGELSSPVTATQGELLSAPLSAPRPREEVPTDEKPRVKCLECPKPREMNRSNIRAHLRTVHGIEDTRQARVQGVGFYFAEAPLGTRDVKVPSVTCPQEHRDGAAKPYWVPVSSRSGHAASHGMHVAEVGYENSLNIEFAVRCTQHPECAQADGGEGYGFMDEHGYGTHLQKEMARRRRLAEQSA
jgi:hypothetical protein